MSLLIEAYNKVYNKISDINTRIDTAENKLTGVGVESDVNIPARIKTLEEQLVKIDEYSLKIKGFIAFAKNNIKSMNIPTIEAPPDYRVNLNRLRRWAMMIDPRSEDDPYAQRVYIVASCDEFFLEKKKAEFTELIAMLNGEGTKMLSDNHERLRVGIASLKKELKDYAGSEDVAALVSAVKHENDRYRMNKAPDHFANKKQPPEAIAPGAYLVPLDFGEDMRVKLKELLGDYYDAKCGRVLLPVELETNRGFFIAINCTPVKKNVLDKNLQNLLLKIIDDYPVASDKIYVLDGLRLNSHSIGSLKQLEDSFVMAKIPRNQEQLTETLEDLVSSMGDMDDMIEMSDSLYEYNASSKASKRLPFTTVVLLGWPNAFVGKDRELVTKLMTNYERYGISFVTVNYVYSTKHSFATSEIPDYAAYSATVISMLSNDTSICIGGDKIQHFVWYSFFGELPQSYATSLMASDTKHEGIGNEYTKRYSITDIPPYTRAYKKLELPFAIDKKDAPHFVSFENENFAAYLSGASRSGKSTLIHTLIAGVIRNYHPDNVELWLADFKQLEFKRYINNLPPHVKYILLDESPELVFDLIDRLNGEMMERQKLFSRMNVQRIDQIDPLKLKAPLPVIFVILDEFSIMSQSLENVDIYKLRLQNLLAKGAALGIRFIFSSQTYDTGVRGLTPTAKAQIQQRIAMKGKNEDIEGTLDLPAALKTQQVKNWMAALPPHYALIKQRISADELPQVKRYLVMYFKDYNTRDDMIHKLNDTMKHSEKYEPDSINTYVDKKPVLIDGNTYTAFNKNHFLEAVSNQQKAHGYLSSEVCLSFGDPRLMVSMKTTVLSSETRENILLVGRQSETACCMSLILSAMVEFKLQRCGIEIWAYEKNWIFQTYGNVFKKFGCEIYKGIDDICNRIRLTKEAIKNRENENKLIVMIGMDRICSDFELIDANAIAKRQSPDEQRAIREAELIRNGAVAQTDDEMAKRKNAIALATLTRKIKTRETAAGKSNTEIDAIVAEETKKFFQKLNADKDTAPENKNAEEYKADVGAENEASKNVKTKVEEENTEVKGAYNAAADYEYIVKQGSRLGRHFLLYINLLADLKQTYLKLDLFRYRLTFQVSVDDSRQLSGNKSASSLPEHICQYYDTVERYSLRPYLHKDVSWEGWYIDDKGSVISPFEEVSN